MSLSALAFSALLLSAVVLFTTTPDADPEPSPDLSAADVIRIQVEALQTNDDPYPDAGIEAAFRFASPGNRAATGPLPRFAQMVKGPVYGDMLDFERAEYSDIALEGDRAAQRVTLVQDDGQRVAYVFTLSRQVGGAYDGCWMTDGVTRRPPSINGTTRI